MINREELLTVKKSFAVAIYKVISCDEHVSDGEKEKFNSFFMEKLGLSQYESEKLLEETKNSLNELDIHLERLKNALHNHVTDKAMFMRFLNECILCDGVDSREYPEFEYIRKAIF